MGKDKMANSPWLWANEEVGCSSKKLKKSQEEWQNNLAETEVGLRFKQSSLIACNQQPSRGAPAVGSSHYESEIKIALSKGIEPRSLMWNCLIVSCKLCFCRKLSNCSNKLNEFMKMEKICLDIFYFCEELLLTWRTFACHLWAQKYSWGALAPKKIRSMHSTEALYFCHQCRELHQRLWSVGVCAVT